MRTISNIDDAIDSRDIISRIEYLESELQSEQEEAAPDADFDEWLEKEAETNGGDAQELIDLRALASEGEAYLSDWSYGSTLIRESYFTEYCQELVSDIGDLPRGTPSYIVIDWEATAENLKEDYTGIDFAGEKYLVR